ncbi:MAG: Holliday junction branch migration protein RuvA [Peptococcaceae bacterium]|jgi:Holliday junction DNA helicase RuvA|nr:Holliday junction branch migration protein RuvA [Peptococcaceae bacterium]
MIAFIRGTIIDQEIDSVTLDVGGIGYQVLIPIQQMTGSLQTGKELALHTYLQVKEDSWTLFGFANKEQLQIFKMLISVNGVGARTGLAILNLLSPVQIAVAIGNGDYKVFNQVPGIGNKISQRIVLELKEKTKAFADDEAQAEFAFADDDHTLHAVGLQEAILAMEQLGYSGKESAVLIRKAKKRLDEQGIVADINRLIKEALQLTLEK